MMHPDSVRPEDLLDRQIGPVTVLFGYERGKYPYGNSMLIQGNRLTAIVDPCLGVVARRDRLPDVDLVIHSHTHEDHIAGTHLFRDRPWYAHRADALGLESLDGLMTMYGLPSAADEAFRQQVETDFFYPHGGEVQPFDEGHLFDLGGVTVRVIHTPGHTRGHCCMQIDWEGNETGSFVYLGDIELTGFGPYYGDAWSDLGDFETSIERLRGIDAHWWLTFHHKGLIEGRDRFLDMLDRFAAMIDDRENRLLEFLQIPRSLEEIVAHRFVYRPGQTGVFIDSVERRSMGMHLDRLLEARRVRQLGDRYQIAV